MRIGINLDDTIIDTYQVIMKRVANFYDIDEEGFYLQYNDYSLLDKFPSIDLFKRENPYEELLSSMRLIESAKEIINRLYEEGNEIIIFSHKSENYRLISNCLINKGIKYNKIILGDDISKECVLNKIDIYIDYDSKNCQEVSLNNIKCYQFKTKFHKKEYQDSVDSWEEMYHKIITKEQV